MAITEILLLSAIGVVIAVVWFSLIRASVCGGCRLVPVIAPEEEEKKDD